MKPCKYCKKETDNIELIVEDGSIMETHVCKKCFEELKVVTRL